MSYEDLTERIIQNNEDIKFDTVLRNPKKKLLQGKKGNHVSFFVSAEDYIPDKSNNKVVCIECTDTFFNIFFKDVKDENDEAMDEIFKLKQYMNYIPSEKVYKCPKCGKIEVLQNPQIEDKPEKRLLGAGIENYPEYVGYLDPNTVSSDFILTANIGNKKTQRSKRPFFKEESEDEIFERYMNSKR